MATNYQRLAFEPNRAETHSNLGIGLQAQDDLAAAIGCFGKAVALDHTHPEAHSNLGNALNPSATSTAPSPPTASFCPGPLELRDGPSLRRRPGRGDCRLQQAITVDPANAGAHANLAMALLAQGDYNPDWIKHKWRWRPGKIQRPVPYRPPARLGSGRPSPGPGRTAEAVKPTGIALRPRPAAAHRRRTAALWATAPARAQARCQPARADGQP